MARSFSFSLSFFSLTLCLILLYSSRPTAAATLAVSPVKRGDLQDPIICPNPVPGYIPSYLPQYPTLRLMCADKKRCPINLGCLCVGNQLLCGASRRAAVRTLLRYCLSCPTATADLTQKSIKRNPQGTYHIDLQLYPTRL